MTRTGKIARLPRKVREQVNRRLHDGEEGRNLVEWLNSLPEVKQVLEKMFGGRAVSEQNLSEWKQGGYVEWLAHQEVIEQVCDIADNSLELGEILEAPITDHLATLIAVRYASMLANNKEELDQESLRKIRALRALCQDIVELRRSDHNAARLAIERERWEIESERLYEQKKENDLSKAKKSAMAPILAAMQHGLLAKAFGGGETGESIAAFLLEIKADLPPGTLSKKIANEILHVPFDAAQAHSK